jgi:ElaB/YqjD/DUF883 family membrane-anchored ribosome-binding protein
MLIQPHLRGAAALYAAELCGASCVAPSNPSGQRRQRRLGTLSAIQGQKESTAAKATTDSNTVEAKSRFNAALDEARAGAAALRAEATDRATAYRNQAKSQSDDWVAQARDYGEQAKGKASDLAVDGKGKVSEALAALGRAVFDTAPNVDEKLGAKYGDYARSASRSLQEASARIDAKSVEELSEDAREMVRKSPGLAIGIAAVGGFLLARLFRGSSD